MSYVVSETLKGKSGLLEISGDRKFFCMYEFLDPDKGNEVSRYFIAFKDFIDFIKYYHDLASTERQYHEVILEDSQQKIRYDIDLENEKLDYETMITLSDVTLELLIEGTVDAMYKKFNINIDLQKDVCIYSSHSGMDAEKKKRSYHIIIGNYFFESNEDVKQFCLEVINTIPTELRGYVDDSVYKSKQNFRILYSHKPESNRYKVPVDTWIYEGEEIHHIIANGETPVSEGHEFFLRVSESLITFCGGCKCLAMAAPLRPREAFKGEEAPEKINLAIEKLNEQYYNGKFPYKFSGVSNGYILLSRTSPMFCPICSRVHDAENAFMTISEGMVSFYCRRNKEKSIKLFLSPIQVPELKQERKLTRLELAGMLSRMDQSIFDEEAKHILLERALR
jgi:hypothetical protein